MRVGDCKAVRSRVHVAQSCCFCEAAIPVGDVAIKFVERKSAKSQAVAITYGCLPCWREMAKDFGPIPEPTREGR